MLDQSFDIAIDNIINAESYSDSIQKRTQYWTSVDLNHKFFIVDSTEFYTNQVLTLNTNYWKYKEFTMGLMFYPRNDLKIEYKPTLVKEQLLYDERGYLEQMNIGSDFSSYVPYTFDTKRKNEEFFIDRPHLVKHVLKTIPEPHRLITDRKHLKRRSANEGIRRLLNEEVTSPDKLDKRIKKKGPWTLSGLESVQFSQAYLSNWTKGGENSVALQSDLLLKANYKKDKIEWENYARHKVGIISSESYPVQINSDEINLNTKYGIKASKKWYYSGVFDFKSQFFNGYDGKERENTISGFMSPAYLTFAIGMDYKRNKDFTLLLSPLTSKMTYVMDTAKVDQTTYNVALDKKTAYNTGASIVNVINWKISTELNLKSKLDAFIGFSAQSEREALKQVDWEIIFDMRINRFLSTRVNTQLRYFSNESNKVQFREYFSINFNYKF
ncbi:DUF3078 domain-containing protein [Labilibacter marinus]|uniref:DUF3078 domain-containing protein n=1 Tax=Labilibacter marinus TaxID=1477105 RepID=UPI00095016CB|nr:DUF3078 domain-containing protein [Labilibacter marinus]